jgi:hypothetical protein
MKSIFSRVPLVVGAFLTWLILPLIAIAMTATNVQPANLVKSNRTTATITFTIAATLPANGKVKIIFPVSYTVSSASGGTCSSMNGGFLTSVSGQTVTITRDGTGTPELVGAQTCTVNNISNPSSTGSTGTYTIQITDSADTVLDQDTAVAADTITATGTISATNFIPENQVANTISRYTANFTTANNLSADGRIKLTFPAGFDVTGAHSPHCSTMDGAFSVSTSGQDVLITRSATGTSQAAAAESCFVRGIKAPADPTTNAGAYMIETQDGLGNPTDSTSTVLGDSFFASTTLTTTNVAPASLVAGAITINTISFTTVTTTPIGAKIRITYPNGFAFQSTSTADCTTIAGTESTVVSGTTITIQTNLTAGEAAGAESCTLTGVMNPTVSGSTGVYTIEVLDESTSNNVVARDLAVSADTITAGTLTATDIAPENLVSSSTQLHTVLFTTQNSIPPDGKIIITYNPGFSTTSTNSATCSGFDGIVTTTTGTRQVILTRSGGTTSTAGGMVECVLRDVRNRDTATASGFYNVTTTNAAMVAIDWAAVAADTYLAPVALTGGNVQPVSLVQNAINDHDIDFTTSVNIPQEAVIRVTYGAGFNLTGAASSSCAGFDGGLSMSTSSQTLILTRNASGTTIGAAARSCKVYGIRNPSATGSTGTYTITIFDKTGVMIGTSSPAADTITVAGTLTSPDISPASLVAGATTTATILFSFANGLPSNAVIHTDFPSDFLTGGLSSAVCSGFGGSVSVSASGTQGLQITRLGNSTGTTSGTASCTVSSIKNRMYSGSTGTYLLAVRDSSGTLIASGSAAADLLSASTITGNVEPDTLLIGATGTANITLNAANRLPQDGKFDVSFPAGYYIGAVATSTISCSGLTGALSYSIAGQTITALRIGGATSSENPSISCSVPNVRNPLSAGSGGAYTLRTKSFGDITIDENVAISADTFSASGTLTATDVQPSNLAVNATTNNTVSFTQALGIPASGTIQVTYPSSFVLSGVTGASCSSLDGSITASVSGTTVILTRDGGTAEPAGAQTCTISGVKNPSSVGSAGTYSITTYTSDGTLIEQDPAVTADSFANGSTGGGGGGGGGGGSTLPVVTTFQTSGVDVAAIRAQIEARLKTLPVAVHSLIKLPDDKNPKTQEDTAVYYVGADGLRHAFPNSKTYFSWYCDFGTVQVVSAQTMASIGLGKNVPYRPGIRLVKFLTDPKVYIVTKGGILRPIPSESFAKQLLGDSWNKQVDDISDAFYTDYQFGAEAANPAEFVATTLAKSVTYPSDSLQIVGNTESAPLLSPPSCSTGTPATNQPLAPSFQRPSSIPAAFKFTSNLGTDSAASIEIRYLQNVLIALGKEIYPEQRATGNFGPATEAALKRYQQSQGLKATGRTDPETQRALNTLLQ